MHIASSVSCSLADSFNFKLATDFSTIIRAGRHLVASPFESIINYVMHNVGMINEVFKKFSPMHCGSDVTVADLETLSRKQLVLVAQGL
jgi:hypothetical protein